MALAFHLIFRPCKEGSNGYRTLRSLCSSSTFLERGPRSRRDAKNGDKLAAYLPFQRRSQMTGQGGSVGPDDLSHVFSANQTIRTYKTTRSQSNQSVAASMRESINAQETTSTAMIFAFSITVEELELMVIEEERFSNGYADFN
jgi:hypothetical protein